jgi:hypothetical protein
MKQLCFDVGIIIYLYRSCSIFLKYPIRMGVIRGATRYRVRRIILECVRDWNLILAHLVKFSFGILNIFRTFHVCKLCGLIAILLDIGATGVKGVFHIARISKTISGRGLESEAYVFCRISNLNVSRNEVAVLFT